MSGFPNMNSVGRFWIVLQYNFLTHEHWQFDLLWCFQLLDVAQLHHSCALHHFYVSWQYKQPPVTLVMYTYNVACKMHNPS